MRKPAGASYGFPGTPDANTLFFCRFGLATPTDEVSGATGTLVGNAVTDTVNGQLVMDGTGDWCTFAGGSQFDPLSSNWTLEWHAKFTTDGNHLYRGTGTDIWQVYQSVDESLGFYTQAALVVDTTSGGGGVDRHYAVVRDAGVWRIYKGGVAGHVNSAGATVPTASNATLYMGVNPTNTSGTDFSGRLGRVKLSNICRYPGGTTFTPPARTDV